MKTCLPCRLLLCAATLTFSGLASAGGAVSAPASPSPCLSQPGTALTPAQQQEQLRQTWRRHCYLADAEAADTELQMKAADQPQDEALKLLDDLLGTHRSLGGPGTTPVDSWMTVRHGDGDSNLWRADGGPGSWSAYANPPYQHGEHYRPMSTEGAALPAVPEPQQYGMLLSGLLLLGAALCRRHWRLNAGKARRAARQ